MLKSPPTHSDRKIFGQHLDACPLAVRFKSLVVRFKGLRMSLVYTGLMQRGGGFPRFPLKSPNCNKASRVYPSFVCVLNLAFPPTFLGIMQKTLDDRYFHISCWVADDGT